MQCPKCNYVLSDFDANCPRCQAPHIKQSGGAKTQALPPVKAAPPPTQRIQPPVPIQQAKPESVIWYILLGIVGAFLTPVLIGMLIAYFVVRGNDPEKGRAIMKGFLTGVVGTFVVALLTIILLTVMGRKITNTFNTVGNTTTTSGAATIDEDVKNALNDRFQINGSPVRCTAVSLSENRPSHYIGTGTFTDGSVLKLDVSMDADGTFIWQVVP